MRFCLIMQNKQLLTFICIVRLSVYDMKAGQQELIVSPQVDYNLGIYGFYVHYFPKTIVKDIHQESIDSKAK